MLLKRSESHLVYFASKLGVTRASLRELDELHASPKSERVVEIDLKAFGAITENLAVNQLALCKRRPKSAAFTGTE